MPDLAETRQYTDAEGTWTETLLPAYDANGELLPEGQRPKSRALTRPSAATLERIAADRAAAVAKARARAIDQRADKNARAKELAAAEAELIAENKIPARQAERN